MLRRGGRMTPSLRRALIIAPIWLTSIVWMWTWWLGSKQVRFMPLFIPLTLALMYEFILLPSVFLYFVIRAKKPARRIAQKGLKVAVISPCVPSTESLDIVENQLKAMVAISYPHDSWILDEGNSPDIKRLAKKYGVLHFSRSGVEKYNQPIPPFQTKTKAGNINGWLDFVKRRKYDYFVQLDIDHIPKPNYLNKTLGYFRDQKVAWVQAPSVYKNLNHWTSLGSAEQELVLQGPLQMGFYGHSETPFIIGSHCTYRMSAIREIGGFQPTRAEDHLDTVHLAHNNYKGVFLPEIIAEGDGPETLNTYLAQQYAWAYSMFQVLLSHTPKLLKTMSWKRKWQFLFAQTWYPLWSLSYLVMFISPVLALWITRDVASVKPADMLIHFSPNFAGGFLVWWSARPLMQPRNIRLSWRGVILHAVRWPIILRAIIAATFKVKKSYMITPKGKFAASTPTLKTYRPFLILGLLSAFSVIVTRLLFGSRVPEGQIVFAVTNAIFMLLICSVDIGTRLIQLKPKLHELKTYWLKPIGATAFLGIIMTASIVTSINFNPKVVASAQVVAPVKNHVTNKPVHNNMTTKELIEQISLVPRNDGPVPNIGIYNPTFNVPETEKRHIQHSFIDWREDHYFALVMARSVQTGNVPLITIEPRGDEDGQKLLSDIISGVYDQRLSDLARVLSASKNTAYIRFAHEMDLANLYPWGARDSELYIKAYRYVADHLREHNPSNVQMVWSPAGNNGSEAYYPGDEYVDVIGTTILYDEYWYGPYSLPSFDDIASKRKWLQAYGKPVWIVEFGAGKANRENQKLLIADALENYGQLGFAALVYLNLKDANIVGPDYGLEAVNDFAALFKEVLPEVPAVKPEPQEVKVAPKSEVVLNTQCQADNFTVLSPNSLAQTQLILSPATNNHCSR
jgi:cellulose synthase (UDP-forming)